jgi:hypothetical protein
MPVLEAPQPPWAVGPPLPASAPGPASEPRDTIGPMYETAATTVLGVTVPSGKKWSP